MPGTIAKGRKAIQEAIADSNKPRGEFRPFLPSIYWKEDKEEHYLLFLTPIEELLLFEMIKFIPGSDGFFYETVAKTDGYFGERFDAFAEKWDATPQRVNLAIAVELEPVEQMVKGRLKPVGFEIKTTEYAKKIYDDDGEPTGEEEDVVVPVVGYITQSPNNFFNHVEHYDANDAPIEETPIKITRLGKDTQTTYSITGYENQDIDLTNLVEYWEGMSFVKDGIEDIDKATTDLDAKAFAGYLGQWIMDKKAKELLDSERYDELLAGVKESMDRFGNKKDKKAKKAQGKAQRPARKRQGEEPAEQPQAEEQPAEKASQKDRMADLRRKVKEKD